MTSAIDRTAWEQAWTGLGVSPPSPDEFGTLLTHYDEPHRAYHTRQHLAECLDQLAQVRNLCDHPDEVALALWYHDAIYKPRRSDNEDRSADWLARVAEEARVAPPTVQRMRDLILATRHEGLAETGDARVLVDIDLSILGAPTARFEEYERQVRREYRWVPNVLYQQSRSKIMHAFLRRPRIYSTDYFFEKLEGHARENVVRSLGGH